MLLITFELATTIWPPDTYLVNRGQMLGLIMLCLLSVQLLGYVVCPP